MSSETMKARVVHVGGEWTDEGGGYFSLRGMSPSGYGEVAYIALPEGHPAIGRSYDGLDPDVNGGLTFGEGNVFGWDYSHYENPGEPASDIQNALDYFRQMAHKDA